MRIFYALLVAVITILANSDAASESTTDLHSSQNLIKSPELNSGRMLRANTMTDETIDPDDEERSITGLAKAISTGMTAWSKNVKLATIVKYESMFVNKEATMVKYLKRDITPDQVYKWLNLKKPKNQWNAAFGTTPEYSLWKGYSEKWMKKYPYWRSKLAVK